MAVESYYFTHDYNSRNDRKIVALRMKEGMAGVGLYWCIVEMLYEEGGYLLLSECERIAFEFRVKEETLKRIITNFELFRNDGLKFWSESALKRLEKRNTKSSKARESALERWNKRNQDANASTTDSNSNAIKESKGKESKGKEIIAPLFEVDVTLPFKSPQFQTAWGEWKSFRKGIKKKITDATAKKQLAMLAGFSEAEAISMINQSIQQGWVGLFEIKNTNGTGNGKNQGIEKIAGHTAHNADNVDYNEPL